MLREKRTPEEIFAQLRQLGDSVSQGAEVTYWRWRQEYGGLRLDQAEAP